jgi:proteasome lid subunit RPN8/RPN11
MRVRLSSNLFEYFTQEERRRHKREIGGFVLGKLREDYIYFTDYMECPNISGCPLLSYIPEKSCTERTCEIVDAMKYEVITLFHTHTSDTLFSQEDLLALLQIYNYQVDRIPPAFLSTYGDKGFFIVYGLNHFVLETRHFVLESRSLDQKYWKHFDKLTNFLHRIEYLILRR